MPRVVFEYRWSGTLQGSQRGARRTKKSGRFFMPKRVAAYLAWKRGVQIQMIGDGHAVPFALDPKGHYQLKITAYWARRARVDRNNVEKAIEDCVVKNDRRVLDSTFVTIENAGADEGFAVQLLRV